jgi:hypothetical protein
MRSPSTKYLYGFTSTFGANVNVNQADYDAVDAEIAAERKAHAADQRVATAARTSVERAAFHLLLTHPSTSARLDAMLEENRQLDARLDAEQLEADIAARELDDRTDDEQGDACSAACSFCGRCS